MQELIRSGQERHEAKNKMLERRGLRVFRVWGLGFGVWGLGFYGVMYRGRNNF